MKKRLSIDCIVNDGSPIGVVGLDIYGENGRLGIGGAELALLTLCEAWHKAGHKVRLYNSPTTPKGSIFSQHPIDTFLPKERRDVLIIFRSPNHRIKNATGKKIWFSTDQYTMGSFRDFANEVDKIVTISQFHAEYFAKTYEIRDTTIIDLPVRIDDYFEYGRNWEIEKVPNRLIFCSVPDRGLDVLANCFPAIQQQIPDVSLVITSDYRLWGVDGARNEHFVRRFMGMEGVKFLGAIPRRELVQEQMKAQIQAYPSTYPELFCYATAECQVAGALPVTSDMGALATTNMGVQVLGNAKDALWQRAWVDMIVQHLRSPELSNMQKEVQRKSISRFSLDRILGEWEKVFENS